MTASPQVLAATNSELAQHPAAGAGDAIYRMNVMRKKYGGVHSNTITNWDNKGLIPKSRTFGVRMKGWLASEVEAHLRGEWEPEADAA